MKKKKGFFLCGLGLCVTAVPLFMDGGGICGAVLAAVCNNINRDELKG